MSVINLELILDNTFEMEKNILCISPVIIKYEIVLINMHNSDEICKTLV